jgi:hypothetical protein
MPTATFKFNISNKVPIGEDTQDCLRYFGTITFSAAADTYATGGLLALAGFAALNLGPYSDRTPLLVIIQSLLGSGYQYLYNPTTKKLMIIAGGGSATAAPVELANAQPLNTAVPNIFTDSVVFELTFPKGN